MLTVMELVARIHDATGHWISPNLIRTWTVKGLTHEKIKLPYERIGGSIRIRWSDFKSWQRKVKKAKAKVKPRGGRPMVPMV